MAQGKPRDPRKKQQWRLWIQQWQNSGLTVRAFCTRHGLAQPSFYAWRRVLQQRDAAAFVPVRLVPDEDPAPARSVEVVLAPGLDAATVRRLLALLEEAPPC